MRCYKILKAPFIRAAVPALRCPSWAFGEPSWTCYTPLTTHHREKVA